MEIVIGMNITMGCSLAASHDFLGYVARKKIRLLLIAVAMVASCMGTLRATALIVKK